VAEEGSFDHDHDGVLLVGLEMVEGLPSAGGVTFWGAEFGIVDDVMARESSPASRDGYR